MRARDIRQRIKEYFLINPTARLRVRQIERLVKVPLPSAIRYTKELEKEGILKSETIAGIKLYSAARMTEKYALEKKLHNIRRLHESGLIKHIEERYHSSAIILFGSCTKGEDTEKSDVDLYVETPLECREDLGKFEKIINLRVQLFCHKNIREIKNEHLANNILNGIILSGYIEVF